MNTKDAIRQRRQDKIRKLLEEQQRAERKRDPFRHRSPVHEPVYDESVQFDRLSNYGHPDLTDEPDPEKEWKANPNPWLGTWNRSDWNGAYSDRYDPPGSDRGTEGGAFWKGLRWKAAAALLLFAAIWAVFRYDLPWLDGSREWIEEAMTEPMDFEAAAAWYRETFAGAPSFIPIFESKEQPAELVDGTVKQPVVEPLRSGVLVKTFAELLSGIELAGESGEQVVAVQTGRIAQVTNGGEGTGGVTIVIQHTNGRMTVYGKLAGATVKKDDWVEAGDPIGNIGQAQGEEPSLLYFAVKQGGRYVDPADVIPLD